jgi:serine/threonine-protein kinase
MTAQLLNNRYRILRALGAGGFGETHLAEDIQMPSGRRCVIKQLKPMTDDPQIYQLVKERFQREAAILEELGAASNQIPKLYAYFESNGQFYLVQEWIEGVTLAAKWQQEGNLTESSVKEILIGLLPVLDYVHGKRIVHRDIKPENIILRALDGKPVLIDFGAVRETMGTIVTSKGNTAQSIVIGTPGFMPSEQSAGRPVYASDIYSLGLTGIYLLTGKIPQEIETDPRTGEILWRRYALSVSPTFSAILDKAIQSHPRDRYSTPKEMLEALYTGASPISSTATFSQPTVVSAQPVGYQPHTVVSAPPAGYQPPVYPQPVPASNSGLGDWQKAAIIGGIIGSCVVAGLFFTRPQTESKPKESPETPVAQSPSPSPSASPSAPAASPSNFPSNPPIPQQPNTTVSQPPTAQSPSQQTQYIAPSAPSISQQKAAALVDGWLQAKRVMFAPPYNRKPASELTTADQYQKVAGARGTIDWLQSNNAYYRYGVIKIDGIDQFAANGNQATIQVRVTEDRTLYKSNGQIDPNETDFKIRTVRYNLQFVDGSWKIASSQII